MNKCINACDPCSNNPECINKILNERDQRITELEEKLKTSIDISRIDINDYKYEGYTFPEYKRALKDACNQLTDDYGTPYQGLSTTYLKQAQKEIKEEGEWKY